MSQKNLYDLLEISHSASPESILASYQRLQDQYRELSASGDEDATNHLIALREAFRTLSNPELRRRYDDRLASREESQVFIEAPKNRWMNWLVLATLLALAGFGYQKHLRDQELAALKAQREIAIANAQAAAAAVRKQKEERAAANQEELRDWRDRIVERIDREEGIARGREVSHELERAEYQAKLEKQREEQRRLAAERQSRYDAERQLAREKAYLRQIEIDNRR